MKWFSSLLLVAATLWGIDPNAFFQKGKTRVLILSGRNNHDWRTTTPRLKQILDERGGFDVRVTEEPAGLTPEVLAPYDVVVSDYNGPRWGRVAEQALDEFVRSGRGLVATHAAVYAFGEADVLTDKHVHTGVFEPPWAEYGRMLGATWSDHEPKSGHGDRHLFFVEQTAGRQGFWTSDELYHNLRMKDGVQVLGSALDAVEKRGTGKHEPLIWTVQYGKGRVFYTALGHDVAAMMAPGFVEMFARGVAWAAAAKDKVPATSASPPVRTTIVTGGHSHEPSFYGIFDGVSWLQPLVDPHPVAYRRDLRKSTDVLVLYDMVQEIPDEQRANLRAFLESGKGLVILHHAVADFQKWEWWWKEVMGVKYVLTAEEGLPASTFRHDVRMKVEVVAKHPVTRGIAPMFIEDETYKGMWFAPGNQVLMRTDEASSDGPVVWISPYRKSRVVVIQLGHGSAAHRHPGYVDLVRNAVRWAGGRE